MNFKKITSLFLMFFIMLPALLFSKNEPKVQVVTSESGIKAWLIEDHSVPLVCISIAFKNSGATFSSKNKSGLPLLTATSLFNCGSGNYSKEEVQNKIQELQAAIGMEVSYDNFFVKFIIPKVNLNEGINLLNDILTKPALNKEEFRKVKEWRISDIISHASDIKSARGERILLKQLFDEHPYSWSEQGEVEAINKFSEKDVKEFVTDFLTHDRALVSCAGDVTPNELVKILNKIFYGLKQKSQNLNQISEVVPKTSGLTLISLVPGTQSRVFFAHKAIKWMDADGPTFEVFNKILGGGSEGNYLHKELREKQGIVYYIGTYIKEFRHSAVLLGRFDADNKKIKNALQSLKEVFKKMNEKGITKEEVDYAKKSLIGERYIKLRTISSLSNYYLFSQLVNEPITALNDYADKISKVTSEDVNRIIKKLNPDLLQIVIVGQPDIELSDKVSIMQ